MNKKSASATRKKMSDIARLAGVSESTVSRALNDSPLINESTRKRIQSIAEQHNYTINKQARNLRLQSSRTISVILPLEHEPGQQVSDPFFMELLGAIADALTRLDYDLLLSRVYHRNWRNRVDSYNHVDGLIIVGQSDLHQNINDFAQDTDIPLVVWGAQLPDQHYVSVGSDNHQGGQLAATHLLQQNRQHILFLGDPQLPEVALRLEGLRHAHRLAGLDFKPERIVSCGFTASSADAAIKKILADKIPFDGLFAASDVLASTAIKRLVAAGLVIPDDVAVVGFDDISIAQHMSPALTTISQHIQQSGQQLVDMVTRQIQGKPTESHIIAPQLIVRSSA